MGISDDIRPKKYRPIESKEEKAARKKAKKEIDNRDDGRIFHQPEENDFFGGTPISQKYTEPKKRGLGWFYTLVIIIAVAALLGVVVWQNYSTIKGFFDGSYKEKNKEDLSQLIDSASNKSKNYSSTTESQTPAQTPATTPAQTATPSIDKKTINISVLNGSGVKNSASTVANLLTTAGFTVSGTGNAKSFNYPKTYIYYKTGGETKADLVKQALPNYQTETSLSNTIVGSNYDIVVVVGKT